MEDVSESDALALLAQFEEAPLHVEESFDLIIPAEIQTEEQKRLQTDIVEVFLDDDDDDNHDSSSPEKVAKSSATSTIHHRPRNSLLAQLLQSSTTSTYIPTASTGLSSQASQLPNAQITESPSNHSPSSVVKDKVVMVLILVAQVEFDLREFQQPSKRVSPRRACYTAFVFQCGCLFLPIQMQVERKKLLNSKDDKFKTIWVKEDQNRKTHDKVFFCNPHLKSSVLKPGTVQSVYLFLNHNVQPFFLNKSALYRVDALYQKMYPNTQFVSIVHIVHRKQGIKEYMQREKKNPVSDIAVLHQWLDKVHKSEKRFLVEACSVTKPSVVCEFCNHSFKSMSEKLYHSYLCQWKDGQTFNLEENIRIPKFEIRNMTCEVCQRSFSNGRTLRLHSDSHFNLTHRNLLPCYPCAKVFFTPWSFINHECFKNRKLVRKLHLNPETVIKVDNMYSQIPAELRDQILKCRACDKQCSFFSQLLSHLHLSSACLHSLVQANLGWVGRDLGLDLAALLGPGRGGVVQCAVCGEVCGGPVSYMMHTDHHTLDTALECTSCNRNFSSESMGRNTACHFYNHVCGEDESPQACVWCEEVQLMERERFRRTQDSLDPDPGQMANQVVELLSSINNNNRDQGGEEEEADDDLKVGGEVDLVFLDQEMAMEHQQA